MPRDPNSNIHSSPLSSVSLFDWLAFRARRDHRDSQLAAHQTQTSAQHTMSTRAVPTAYEEANFTPETSPELTKRSWFGSLMGTERDETHVILVKDRPLAAVKADLIHAFLSVSIFRTRNAPSAPGTIIDTSRVDSRAIAIVLEREREGVGSPLFLREMHS